MSGMQTLPSRDSVLLSWLSRLVSPDGARPSWAERVNQIHDPRTDWYWTFATDARVLLAVAGLVEGAEPFDAPNNRAVLSYLAAHEAAAESVPLDALRGWCGAVRWPTICAPCDGESCTRCDGEGTAEPFAEPRRFLDKVINRVLLARGLSGAWGGSVRVSPCWKDTRGTADGPVLFEAGDVTLAGQPCWRVVMMPMRDGTPDARTHLAPGVPGHVLSARDGLAARLARSVRDRRAWGDLPVLSDALEECGCGDPVVLAHLRAGVPHGRRCWCVEAILEGMP